VGAAVWLRVQAAVMRFNRTPPSASALMVCTREVFLHNHGSSCDPNYSGGHGLIPWKADVVILLSDDWVAPTDIRGCFRLRLTSAGDLFRRGRDLSCGM
jgi:hypothetical protein